MKRLLHSIRQFLSELRRRNVYQVAATYIVVGFFVIEAADLTLTRLGLPAWTVTFVIVLVGLGFPIALVLAWALEVTPEGVRVEEPEGSEEELRTTTTTRDLWVGGSVLVLLLLGAWWMWGGFGDGAASKKGGGKSPETKARTIAVLPFEVSGAGAEEWRDGMVTALSLNLDGAAGLRAIPDRRIFAAAHQVDSARAEVGASPALSVARKVGANYAVLGSALQLGAELRLGVEVRRARSGEQVGKVEVRGSPDSITALTDDLTRKILGVLLEKNEAQVPPVDLASITTSSLPALKAYLRGERHFRAGNYEAAIGNYEEAIRIDSTFALAFERLGLSEVWSGGPSDEEQYFRRIYEMRKHLPTRARRLLSGMYLWEVPGLGKKAADSLRALTKIYPDDPRAWYYLAEVLRHENVPGGWHEADEAFRRAVELDPGVVSYHYHLVDLAMSLHHDSALAAERIEAHPPGPRKQMYEQAFALVFGPESRRKEVFAHVDSIPQNIIEGLYNSLLHPTDAVLREEVLSQLLERKDLSSEFRAALKEALLSNNLDLGQVDEALSDLQALQSDVPLTRCPLVVSKRLRVPPPDSVLRARLEPSRIEKGAPAGQLMCAGFYLVEEGRSGELSSLISRLREAGGDDDEPKVGVQERVEEVQGYRAWRNGNLEQAAELWANSNQAGPWGAIWRGDLYRELGELRKAEGWYLAAWQIPLTHERLGRLYEEMGRPQEAAEAYERFIEAWKDADPELQGRVEKARERLDALGGKKGAK